MEFSLKSLRKAVTDMFLKYSSKTNDRLKVIDRILYDFEDIIEAKLVYEYVIYETLLELNKESNGLLENDEIKNALQTLMEKCNDYMSPDEQLEMMRENMGNVLAHLRLYQHKKCY
ncbi:hypothetical protein FHS15_005086 [Paenibacillus castaneae]|uniref:hypothetical protein n=1 Tax=Paenibacillus castaneae TaxID=474957 RepID=UPI000C9A351C|nr:hypothetical protein [Paenibacillus castaneae]NIK79912.1 hypothetical protein [Paenibacillus castaneae]